MPDLRGHRQKTINQEELEKRTELIVEEILGGQQEAEEPPEEVAVEGEQEGPVDNEKEGENKSSGSERES